MASEHVLYIGMDIAGWAADERKECVAVAVVDIDKKISLLAVERFEFRKSIERLMTPKEIEHAISWRDLMLNIAPVAHGIGRLAAASDQDPRAVVAIDAPFGLTEAVYNLPALADFFSSQPSVSGDPKNDFIHRQTECYCRRFTNGYGLSTISSSITAQATKAQCFLSLAKHYCWPKMWIWPFPCTSLYPFGIKGGNETADINFSGMVTFVEAYPAAFLGSMGLPYTGYKGKKQNQESKQTRRSLIVGYLRAKGVTVFSDPCNSGSGGKKFQFSDDQTTQRLLTECSTDENGDKLDAVLCVLTAIVSDVIRWKDNFCAIDEDEIATERVRREGWICIPRTQNANIKNEDIFDTR
jgi:hypothetical protein